jgi:hypothetical protein
MLNQPENALVECRRAYEALNQLNDLYRNENTYKRDAFMYNFMGMMFEYAREYNDAFICYKNAYEIYKQDYEPMFGVRTPEQLKQDVLRSAYLAMMPDMVQFYEREFNIKYKFEPIANDEGDVVIFWNNGLCPIKTEWSINFTVWGNNGMVTFANSSFNINIVLQWPNPSTFNSVNDIKFIRAAFPKYQERSLYYTHAEIDNKKFEVAQNINAIAFKTLEDRLKKEMANTLLRVAVKKAAELSLRSQNNTTGMAVGLINAITEKADTRNCQLFPYHISYLRLRLPAETKSVLCSVSGLQNIVKEIPVKLKKGHLTFAQLYTMKTNGLVY